MDTTPNGCALVDRENRLIAYIANTMPPEEVEVFEAHYFGCDECWKEVQEGLEIRAGFTRRAAQEHLSAPSVRPACPP